MRRPVLALFAVASLGLAACSAADQGRAVPQSGGTEATTSAATTRSETARGEAPPITGPELDLRRYVDKPCELLTSAQEEQLGLHPGVPDESSKTPECDWKPVDRADGTRFMLGIRTDIEGGLDGVYRVKNNYDYFQPAGPIGGYPAVNVDITSTADRGACTTMVGVMKDLVFDVSVFVNDQNSPDYKKPCAVADRFAELVVQNLKAGN